MPEPGLDTRLMAKTPAALQALTVLARIGVVLGEDVLLNAYEVMRRMTRGPLVVMMVMVVMIVVVVVVMLALMAATAYAAHLCLLLVNVQCVTGDSSRSSLRISSRIRCMIFFASSENPSASSISSWLARRRPPLNSVTRFSRTVPG